MRAHAASRLSRVVAAASVVAVMTTGAATAQGSGEVRIGVPRLPARMDPAAATPGLEPLVFHQVFQGLVAVGEGGDLEPGLAASWSVSRDGLTWTFRLRPDVRFHDGTPLTTESAVASFTRHLTPPTGDDAASQRSLATWQTLFQGPGAVVREVRAGEGGTLHFLLKTPFSPLLAALAHPGLAVVLTRNDADLPFLGTGPYRVSERAAGRLTLEAVPGHAGGLPRATRLSYQVGEDVALVGSLRPGGPLDLVFTQGPPAWAGLGLTTLSTPTRQLGLLALRSDRGPLARRVVRQAVLAALDPALVEPALGRWAVPWRALLPPGTWGGREGSAPRHDPILARRLLAEAGLAEPVVSLLVPELPSGPDFLRLAEAIRISLGVAGVRVSVRAEPEEAYARALRQGDAELAIHEVIADIDDPHFVLRPLLAADATVRGTATNVAFHRDPRTDSMLVRGSQLTFRPERLRLYHRLQAHAAEELAYIPLYARLAWVLARPRVRDLRLVPHGRHRLDQVWIDGGAPNPS